MAFVGLVAAVMAGWHAGLWGLAALLCVKAAWQVAGRMEEIAAGQVRRRERREAWVESAAFHVVGGALVWAMLAQWDARPGWVEPAALCVFAAGLVASLAGLSRDAGWRVMGGR